MPLTTCMQNNTAGDQMMLQVTLEENAAYGLSTQPQISIEDNTRYFAIAKNDNNLKGGQDPNPQYESINDDIVQN